MATVIKTYTVTINTTQYILNESLYKLFCALTKTLVNDYTSDMDEVLFIISFNSTLDWIRVARDGDTFTVVGTGGNTEIMTLAQFNSFTSLCRTTSKGCNC